MKTMILSLGLLLTQSALANDTLMEAKVFRATVRKMHGNRHSVRSAAIKKAMQKTENYAAECEEIGGQIILLRKSARTNRHGAYTTARASVKIVCVENK